MNNKFFICIIAVFITTAAAARSNSCTDCCEYNNYKSNQQLAKSIAWTQSSIDLTAPYVGRWAWTSE